MKDDQEQALIAAALTAITAAFISAFVFVVITIADKKCTAQWKDSGMAFRYEVVSGCMIEHEHGKWMPAKAYRQVD